MSPSTNDVIRRACAALATLVARVSFCVLIAFLGACAPLANGEACGAEYCASGLVCRPGDRGQRACASCLHAICKGVVGQPCGADAECASGICAPVGDGAACQPAAGDACAPCEGASDCASSLCQGGTCRIPAGMPSGASFCCAEGASSEAGSCKQQIGSACASDGDCLATAWCHNGACAAPWTAPGPCTSARSCAAGLSCKAGGCRFEDGAGLCAADEDCLSGACVAGTCVPKALACGACDSAADCLAGICTQGICLAEPGAACTFTGCCPDGLLCYGAGAGGPTCASPQTTPGTACTSSAQCAPPMACANGACFVPLGAACVPGADALCTPGTVCIGAVCIPPQILPKTACSDPSHCTSPMICAGGQCKIPDGSPCMPAEDGCAQGTYCNGVTCVPQPTGMSCLGMMGQTVCIPTSDPAVGSDAGLVGALPAPPGGLPANASLSWSSFVVANQGGCGSCVAFATRNAMGLKAIEQQGMFTDFSAAHIWSLAGYGAAACGKGSNIGTVVDANTTPHQYVVPSSVWPYNVWDPQASLNAVPSAAVLQSQGVAYITSSVYLSPGNLNDIKTAIAMGWPTVVAVAVYRDYGWNPTDGHIVMPPIVNSGLDGYHAITIYSYDDATETFGFINSWGIGWGSGGRGTMTYDFVQYYSTGGRALLGLTYSNCSGSSCGSCGDGVCNAMENQSTCCVDCGCGGGNVCQAGVCTCPTGLVSCGGQCKSLASDPANCGACGHQCQANQVCLGGQCKLSCGGLTDCNNACVDLLSSTASCGACGHACAPNEACSVGQCVCVPTSPSTEVCDGLDNDCDGVIDEDPACVVCVPLDDVSLFPLANTMGDAEFNDHGPDVDVTVSLSRTPTTITAMTCVTMKETVADWTTGVKCVSQTKYLNNTALMSEQLFEVKYVDGDHAWDDAIAESYYLQDNSVVTSVNCIGDTSGDDVCSGPGCSTCVVTFGCVKVRAPSP